MLKFKSVNEAAEEGADLQLYEWERHTLDTERFIEKELVRFKDKPNRVAVPVKQGIYISLFVDNLAKKEGRVITWD